MARDLGLDEVVDHFTPEQRGHRLAAQQDRRHPPRTRGADEVPTLARPTPEDAAAEV